MNEKTKSFCGTPYWMAPEIIRSEGHNRFADIWSLGCTVFEMLTKNPPWSNIQGGPFVVMRHVASTNKPPKYPDDISENLKDFLDCCF